MIFVTCADEQWRSLSRSDRGYGLAGDTSAFPRWARRWCRMRRRCLPRCRSRSWPGGRGVRAAGGDRRAAGGHRGAPPAAGSSASIRRTASGNLFAYRPCLDLAIGW